MSDVLKMDAVQKFLCRNESLWDTNRLVNSTWPQLTQCFQWTVLPLVPCVWVWLTLPVHVWYIRHHPPDFFKIGNSKFNSLKIVVSVLLAVLSIANAIVTALSDQATLPARAVYVSSSLTAVSYSLVAYLTRSSRKAGLTSPCLLFIFWLLSSVCHVVPVYSFLVLKIYSQENIQFDILSVAYGLVLIQFLMSFKSESLTHKYPLDNSTKKTCPELTASFPSKLTFHWMTSYIWKGFRQSLSPEDIWELPQHFKSAQVVPDFQDHWDSESFRVHRKNECLKTKSFLQDVSEQTSLLAADVQKEVKHKPSLCRTLFKTYAPDLLRAHAIRLVADTLLFVLPVLTNQLINFVQTKKDHIKWHGYALVVCFFLVAFIYSLLFNQNSYRGANVGMKVRTALIAAVYKKSLAMNTETKRKYTIGKIMNLMAIDCQILQDVTSNLYIVTSAPFQISIAFYFLYRTLGVSSLAGVVLIIALIPLNAKILILAKRIQWKQLDVKDERIRLMNEILTAIKVVKMYTWENSFVHKVRSLRSREMTLLKSAAILNVINVFTWLCSPVLMTTVTFISCIYASSHRSFDSNTAFVSLILFNILANPMNKLAAIISDLISVHVSISRIEEYLCSPDLNTNVISKENVNEKSCYEGQGRNLHLRSGKNAVTISNGTFYWDKTMPPVLKSIDLTIPEGKLVAVVGQMGAGKSSLLSAILGEMEKTAGEVTVRGSVAYVPQRAWIQNKTIKQNIIFEQHYNNSRYSRVLKACALKHDLEVLNGGENAEIGEHGTNLSGGQKQRISLARAVYSDASVYLFDDPLSAVDTLVGKHIFKNVISNSGLLKHKTRVLVTHGVHWLPMVDQIIVLHWGHVLQTGSYEDLLRRDGPFAQFLKNYLLDDDEVTDPEISFIRNEMWKRVDSVTSDGLTSADEEERPRRQRRVRRQSFIDSVTHSSKFEGQSGESILSKPENLLVEEEKSETGKVKFFVICHFLKAFGPWFALMLLFLLLGYQSVGVGASILLSIWTDDPCLRNKTLVDTDLYRSRTFTYVLVYSALGFVQALCALGFVSTIYLRMVEASKHLHDDLLENIMHQPMKFFDTTPVGRILNRFSRDVDMVDSTMPRLVRMFSQQLFTVLSVVVVISYTTPLFVAAIFPVVIIYYLLQKLYIPTSRQLRRNESTTRSPIYSHFNETLTGVSTIRAFNAVDRFSRESQKRVDVNNAYIYTFTSASRWIRIRLELLGNVIVASAALLAVVTDSLTGSLVGLSISYALQVTSSLNELVQNATQLESNVVSVERIVEYSMLPQEPSWKSYTQLRSDWPSRGDITFQSYSTRYRPDLDLVLLNINCHIKGGEKIGIVGRTGAGKSSISMALFRMIESAEGSIIIDGIDIAEVGLHDLRSRITIIPQDPVLFSGTLRFNLDPFNVYSDTEIWTCLEHAKLKSIVLDLPGGLLYVCEDGGHNLSVGQRQLVCLARSLLRKNKILILDEATAAVDLETDGLIQETIRLCFKNCTVLTVAHRINTIMDYDRILVLANGSIAEYGTVETLLTNKGSTFYGMVKEANLLPYRAG
ncbi:multidrug resistance-associated protein 1-like [Physella acuta]|uniref:multidrug resistance-associated protein 1-like n=1 Tax=Physella acuta TaxID=109671 RepID=UPI0027DB13DE|nr:multidrug resistance-associated protein 1-like [Physella acuta]